jgi:glycosyltransferase involved in cell wall biosynthesis
MTQVVNGYLRWHFPRFEVRVLSSRDGSKGWRALWLFAGAAWQLATLRQPARNVIVVHLSQGGSFVREGLLLRLARARGFGTVAHLHGSRFVDFAARHRLLVGWVLGAATKVIALSDATRDAAARLVPADRVEIVPNAVPDGRPAAKERLVVFGGSVSRRKGVDVLAQAWHAVGAGSGWQLEIVGPVADQGIVPPGLPDARLRGPLPHAALMALLDRSAVAVLPSRDEAMPMFILEALARNNCVISTRVGGIPAVLGEERGLLVDPGDVAQLSQALHSVLTDDALRERTAAKGRASFDRSFSATAVYPRVEDLWARVLAQPEPST